MVDLSVANCECHNQMVNLNFPMGFPMVSIFDYQMVSADLDTPAAPSIHQDQHRVGDWKHSGRLGNPRRPEAYDMLE